MLDLQDVRESKSDCADEAVNKDIWSSQLAAGQACKQHVAADTLACMQTVIHGQNSHVAETP